MSVLIKRALCKEFLAFYVTVTKLALNRFVLILVQKDFRGLQFFKNLYSGSRVLFGHDGFWSFQNPTIVRVGRS
jgi:hypothetical protein